MEIHELWDDPLDGLPPDGAPWDWELESAEEDGPTKNPPNRKGQWKRWYFVYHMPLCTNIKISADKDPQTGKWFNPHESSGDP